MCEKRLQLHRQIALERPQTRFARAIFLNQDSSKKKTSNNPVLLVDSLACLTSIRAIISSSVFGSIVSKGVLI